MSNTAPAPITLYGYATSPFVQKVYCYLLFKRLQFAVSYVNPVTNRPLEFTGQRQVPVLSIAGQWRKESSQLGLWLDEIQSEHPLGRGAAAKQKHIRNIDSWVSQRLIFANFYGFMRLRNPLRVALIGWYLGSIVRATSGIRRWQQWLWPLAIRKAGFIHRMLAENDWRGSYAQLHADNLEQIQTYLQNGPFLGGFVRPTLADVSAFAPIAHGYLLGSPAMHDYLQLECVKAWFIRMRQHIPQPLELIPTTFHRRQLPA